MVLTLDKIIMVLPLDKIMGAVQSNGAKKVQTADAKSQSSNKLASATRIIEDTLRQSASRRASRAGRDSYQGRGGYQ